MINSILQWAGTISLFIMYILMSFYPQLYPYDLIAGGVGGLCYFSWSLRTHNMPQVLVNLAGITVCLIGLFRVWG